jgi:uncharacterized protein YkuJ
MKQLLNIYVGSAIAISIVIFTISYMLRQQPIYEMRKTILDAMSGQQLSQRYSAEYIGMVKEAYFHTGNKDTTNLKNDCVVNTPNDSIFLMSLKQIISACGGAAQDFPIVRFEENGTLKGKLYIREKENFYIDISFKKDGDKYIFDKISNISLLLHYHPEFRQQFGCH